MKTITKCSSLILAALLIAGCRNVICLIPSDLCPTQYPTFFTVCGPRGCHRQPCDAEDAKMAAKYRAYERKREKKVVPGLGGSLHKKDAY